MSKIEVNTVAPQCGTTLTLGESGDTVTLGSGASQSGFGRTGTVDWQTTTKTGDFTAVNGQGYFVDTTSTAITMTMPSGSAGAIVSIQDYNKTFDDNNFTVTPASGEKINGGGASAPLTITTEGQGLTFVYVDGTVGWKTVHENEFTGGGSNFITATGGTITTSPCGNDKIHTFTGPGTFCVSSGGSPTNGVVSYLVVAGGGAGGFTSGCNGAGGGGGAGGYREFKSPVTPYTASPLDGNPGGTSISILGVGSFPIQVGGGGPAPNGPATGGAPTNDGGKGSDSIFSTVTSTGGGAGGFNGANVTAKPGGSGGGGGNSSGNQAGGSGNTPPVSPAQGNNGGAGAPGSCEQGTGGGGGSGAAGGNGATTANGDGGAGVTSSINGTPTARAGGGGGGGNNPGGSPGGDATGGAGGSGGGGAGGSYPNNSPAATAGTTNTGGGGGAGGSGPAGSNAGANGGSGIVIIRYKFQ